MSSRVAYVCVFAGIAISYGASAEIVYIGDCDAAGHATASWTDSGTYASPDSISPWDYGHATGWNFTYTTETASLDWAYSIYAYVSAHLRLYSNETCTALAFGSAAAYCPEDSHSMDVDVYVQDAGEYGEHVWDSEIGTIDGVPYYEGFYNNGWAAFDPWDGVFGGHGAYSEAEICPGENDKASSHGCVWAWGVLE